jgi:DNA-directed RNA polymerase subunit M/transcription elongation factor TFIIS
MRGGEMWRRKGCPRCRGDLFIDEDVGSNYIKCLQCGYEKELAGRSLSSSNREFKKPKLKAITVL